MLFDRNFSLFRIVTQISQKITLILQAHQQSIQIGQLPIPCMYTNNFAEFLQNTTTELTELESSIKGKNSQILRLQEEILSMDVKRETLSKQMEAVTDSHAARY